MASGLGWGGGGIKSVNLMRASKVGIAALENLNALLAGREKVQPKAKKPEQIFKLILGEPRHPGSFLRVKINGFQHNRRSSKTKRYDVYKKTSP